MMANAFSPKIVAAPFVRPDVEYCSPQYDRMSSCPADIEHVNGFGSSRGGGRVCSSASWSGDMGGRKSKTKDRAAGIRVDVAGGDATTPISDEELDVSVEDSITSSSSGIPACKMLEDGSRGAVNQNGSSVNEDLNGNNKSATETNNNDDNNKCSNNQLLQTDGNLNR